MKKLIFTISFLFLAACGKSKQQIYSPSKEEAPVQVISEPQTQPQIEIKTVSQKTCEEINEDLKGDFIVKMNDSEFLVINKGLALFLNQDQSVTETGNEIISLGDFCDLEMKESFISQVNFPQKTVETTPVLVPSCGGWSNPCPNYQPTPPPVYGPCGPYPCPPQY